VTAVLVGFTFAAHHMVTAALGAWVGKSHRVDRSFQTHARAKPAPADGGAGKRRLAVFLLGATGPAMVPALQTRLMDVSADAQLLAAALNHSALNIANALGPWLGGLVIAAGHGYTSTAWVGAGLAVAGLLVETTSRLIDRQGRRALGGLATTGRAVSRLADRGATSARSA